MTTKTALDDACYASESSPEPHPNDSLLAPLSLGGSHCTVSLIFFVFRHLPSLVLMVPF